MDAFGNSYDEDDFEFCLPQISYGNYGAPDSYAFDNRSASEGEFHFYNTIRVRASTYLAYRKVVSNKRHYQAH